MKKLYKFIIGILCMYMLGGCGASKLSDNYNENKLKESSEKLIDCFNNEKYDNIVDGMDDSLKKQVSSDQLKEAWSNFKKVGKYKSISKIIFQEKNSIAIVVVIAQYENSNVQFTLSYNKDMKLVGVYFK